MHTFFHASFLSFLLAVPILAAPAPFFVTHEKRDTLPTGWTKTGRVSASTILPMRFGLVQSNLDGLYDMLMAVSDPNSASYGQYWPPEKVSQTFAPNASTINAVSTWLNTAGIDSSRLSLSSSQQWLTFDATASEAENLLNTEYYIYTDATSAEQIACDSYSLPNSMSGYIDVVKPTLQATGQIPPKIPFPTDLVSESTDDLSQVSGGGQSLTSCDLEVTPACLRALYGINYEPTHTQNNSFGIVEYGTQNFLQSDLNAFFKLQSPNQVEMTPNTVFLIDGGALSPNNSTLDHAESDLDLQFVMALTNPQPITLLQGASFDDWTDGFNQPQSCEIGAGTLTAADITAAENGGANSPCYVKPPNVVSISYGDDEINFTPAQAARMCNELGKIGLMGTTVLYSAGDHGVSSNGGQCSTNGKVAANGNTAVPLFPATCPFITAVGATQIQPGAAVTEPEEVWNQGGISSGGGFSNIFAMPSYQADAVSSFMKNHSPHFGVTVNLTGTRAYPDLSANGANYSIVLDGAVTPVSGTSAAAPVIGSVMALINDARIAAGKSTLGFINPAIYSGAFAEAFNDITISGAQGCDTKQKFGGFNATTGWDPVTGLGTPNFPKLMSKFLALP